MRTEDRTEDSSTFGAHLNSVNGAHVSRCVRRRQLLLVARGPARRQPTWPALAITSHGRSGSRAEGEAAIA